jgi:hypothetical protein
LLACPPDDDPTHGKLSIFGVGEHGGSKTSNRLGQEVEKLSRCSITQEAMVNSVLDKVIEIHRPKRATVRGDFDSGEGLRVSIEATYGGRGRAVEGPQLRWKKK